MVKRVPEASPEALARLGHDPPDGRHVAVGAGPPGRRGRHAASRRRSPGRSRRPSARPSAGSARGGAAGCRRACRGARGTSSSGRPTARTRAGRRGPRRPSARWSRMRGSVPRPMHAVAPDRVVDLEPPQQRVRVVVGHVEVGEVGPHLERRRCPRRAAASGAAASASATGAGQESADTTGGRSLSRCRTSGVTTPTATAPHASRRRARVVRSGSSRAARGSISRRTACTNEEAGSAGETRFAMSFLRLPVLLAVLVLGSVLTAPALAQSSGGTLAQPPMQGPGGGSWRPPSPTSWSPRPSRCRLT